MSVALWLEAVKAHKKLKREKRQQERQQRRQEQQQHKQQDNFPLLENGGCWQIPSKFGIDVVQIRGDNETVIDWFNGKAQIKNKNYQARVAKLQLILHDFWSRHSIAPTQPYHEWSRHTYREHNEVADKLANLAMDVQSINQWFAWDRVLGEVNYYRLSFDGGRRHEAKQVGIGWVLEVWQDKKVEATDNNKRRFTSSANWFPIFHGALCLCDTLSSLDAELIELEYGICTLQEVLEP